MIGVEAHSSLPDDQNESCDAGLQQIVQPGGPGSFFKGDMHVPAKPFDKLQDHARFRFDDTFHHDLAGSIPDRDRNAFLVHVHADIFSAVSHKKAFLSGWFEASTQTLLQKGRPFYIASLRSHARVWGFPRLSVSDQRQLGQRDPRR
jgi:hypothetical protein